VWNFYSAVLLRYVETILSHNPVSLASMEIGISASLAMTSWMVVVSVGREK
jgi:hypothetical protein